MTMSQVLVIFGLHFRMVRILALFGWARILIRGEIYRVKLNSIDLALLWWTLSAVVLHTMLWQTSGEFINEVGHAYDAIGMFFLFRALICSFDDVRRLFIITAVLIVPLAASMVVEFITGKNIFASFGVLHAVVQIRDGALRCEGPFAHPILAGTYGATIMPFFVAIWREKKGSSFLPILAIISSLVIVITTGSSGPYLTAIVAIGGLCMWPWRKHMRLVRWGVLVVLGGLHLIMKAPVWFLIARIDVLSGSTGFHRAYLIDRAISIFSEWWLLGMKSTESFGEQIHGDITNEYILQGINAGFLTMVLFIFIIVQCFRAIGKFQGLAGQSTAKRFYVWAMGAALFSHVITYLSISYFDQNLVNWYLLLAIISLANDSVLAKRGYRSLVQERVPSYDRLPKVSGSDRDPDPGPDPLFEV